MMISYSMDSFLYGMPFRKLMEKEIEAIRKEDNLNKIDVQILSYLHNAGERNTSKDIMQLNMFTRGHISQALSRLQKKGYIVMEQDLEDRRCTHNYLTSKADAIISEIEDMRQRVYEIIFDGVTDQEKDTLASVAAKISCNIRKNMDG